MDGKWKIRVRIDILDCYLNINDVNINLLLWAYPKPNILGSISTTNIVLDSFCLSFSLQLDLDLKKLKIFNTMPFVK